MKITLLSAAMRSKKQRLQVVRGVHCSSQCVFRTPNESNPACERIATEAEAQRVVNPIDESTFNQIVLKSDFKSSQVKCIYTCTYQLFPTRVLTEDARPTPWCAFAMGSHLHFNYPTSAFR